MDKLNYYFSIRVYITSDDRTILHIITDDEELDKSYLHRPTLPSGVTDYILTKDRESYWEYPIQWYLDQFTVVERNVTSILNKIGGTLVQIVRVNESDILPSTEPTGFSSVVYVYYLR